MVNTWAMRRKFLRILGFEDVGKFGILGREWCGIALTVAVDIERAEFKAAVMSVTSIMEYKMISSRLGLMHLVGRIVGRRERG